MGGAVCHFCHREVDASKTAELGWDIVYQCYVCPDCMARVRREYPRGGWAAIVPGGAYAEGRPDPRESEEWQARRRAQYAALATAEAQGRSTRRLPRYGYDIRRRRALQRAAEQERKLMVLRGQVTVAQQAERGAERRARIAWEAQQAFAQNLELSPEHLEISHQVLFDMRGPQALQRLILTETLERWEHKMREGIVGAAKTARTLPELRQALAAWVTLKGFEPWEIFP